MRKRTGDLVGVTFKKGFLSVVPLQDLPNPAGQQAGVHFFTITGTMNSTTTTIELLKPVGTGAPIVFYLKQGSTTLTSEYLTNLGAGHYTTIELPNNFVVTAVSLDYPSTYDFDIVTEGIGNILVLLVKKLQKINKKLDYAIRIASEKVSITNSYTAGVSGITVNSCDTNMSGNDLFVYASLSLNTTAQNSIGTGSLTEKLILTVTCSNLVSTSTSTDNDVNFAKIAAADTTVVFPSGEGASPAASFHAVPSISGSTLTIKIYVKNVKAKASAWFLRVKLPVLRVEPYTN